MALEIHPDKVVENKEIATEKFQKLSIYYGILSDANKRKRYDETGSIQDAHDTFDKDDDVSWIDFFKQMFYVVNQEKIEDYKKIYQCKIQNVNNSRSRRSKRCFGFLRVLRR